MGAVAALKKSSSLSISLPVVYMPYAASVGMTEATLAFSATSSTFAITRAGIIYSTSPENVMAGTRIEGSINGENVTTTLPALKPGTTYYAVGYAASDVGEVYSEVMSFTTRLTPGRDANPTP